MANRQKWFNVLWMLAVQAAFVCGCSGNEANNNTVSCPSGQSDCPGVCAALDSDPYNCGFCGNLCPTGAQCISGACGCPAGTSLCDNACVNLLADANYCGQCDISCAPNSCSNGMCITAAPMTGGTDISGTGGSDTGSGGQMGTGGDLGGDAGAGGSVSTCDTSWDTTLSKNDDLALSPPMGWNSWNVFHENINETQIKEIADALVSSGMKDAGYVYLNLDDRWMDDDGRDAQGNLMGDSVRFASGIKALADYVHDKGLKLGIYGDRGTKTCANVAGSGSYGNETRDAQTFASWGVDYLKYDNCNIPGERNNDQAQQQDYENMAAALKASGRPIVFSICAWDYKDWMPATGHLWRTTLDIKDCWHESDGCIAGGWETGIVQIIDDNDQTAAKGGPGHWNDPDMLEVGNGNLSATEYRAHFSLWAIMAAPLIAGNDIRNMTTETHDILTNSEVIAVDQDAAGIQGTRVVDNGDLEVWMKPLCSPNGPEKAVALFNRSSIAADISVSFSDIGVVGKATVRDLWAHQDMGEFQDTYSAQVPSRGVVMLKVVDVAD